MTKNKTRRVMRSRSVRIALVGAAAFSVAGCREEVVEAQVFPTLTECTAAAENGVAGYTPVECEAAFAEAQAAHTMSAPRYDEQALCEEQHGGECYAEARPGGGSIFMPLMMGYMMGSMMNNGRQTLGAQPLYRTGAGTFATPSGTTTLNSNRGTTQMRASSFQPAPATSAARPMSRATVRSTGGFGASRTSFGGGGSRGFGG